MYPSPGRAMPHLLPASAEPRTEAARYWTRGDLGGLELLWARFRRHSYRPHSHPGYVIAVVTHGVETVNCRGSLHRAGPGHILFINPEEIHDGQSGAEAGWQYRVFYPSVDAARALAAGEAPIGMTPALAETVVRHPALARRLARLHSEAECRPDPLRDQGAWLSLFAELLARYASRGGRASDRAEPVRIGRVRALIEAECEKPLTLDRLAAEADLSPCHLIRLFKAATGVSPHAYLIAQRVRRAKALLDRRIDAAEAALATGFADQSHLIRHFKATYGMTPGAYAAARAA